MGEVCSEFAVDKKKIARVKKAMLDGNVVTDLSETFKVLGDPSRMKIIYALSKNELCVCEICEIVGMNQSAVSHQLRVLRNMKLVKFRKEGRMVYYSLDDEHISTLFSEGLAHVLE